MSVCLFATHASRYTKTYLGIFAFGWSSVAQAADCVSNQTINTVGAGSCSIPEGVRSVTIVADGASGSGWDRSRVPNAPQVGGSPSGSGARTTVVGWAVRTGDTLNYFVGGGGQGDVFNGGGGGATSVSLNTNPPAIISGGGGGAGFSGFGGSGGGIDGAGGAGGLTGFGLGGRAGVGGVGVNAANSGGSGFGGGGGAGGGALTTALGGIGQGSGIGGVGVTFDGGGGGGGYGGGAGGQTGGGGAGGSLGPANLTTFASAGNSVIGRAGLNGSLIIRFQIDTAPTAVSSLNQWAILLLALATGTCAIVGLRRDRV